MPKVTRSALFFSQFKVSQVSCALHKVMISSGDNETDLHQSPLAAQGCTPWDHFPSHSLFVSSDGHAYEHTWVFAVAKSLLGCLDTLSHQLHAL